MAKLLVVLLILCLPGCYAWHVEPLVPMDTAAARIATVRVALARDTIVLVKVRVTPDSVIGERERYFLFLRPRRAAIAVADVQQMEVRRYSAEMTRTAVAFGLIGTGAVALVVLGILRDTFSGMGGLQPLQPMP